MAWTLLAIAIFCIPIADHVRGTLGEAAASTTLPDVDTALLLLMGIGHAGYAAKKALDRVQPNARKLVPAAESSVVAEDAQEDTPPGTQAIPSPP